MKWLRRASVLGDCSKHVARQQQSFCRQMCCVCVEQRMICRRTSEADVLDLLKPRVCVVSQVWGCLAGQKRVNETCQFEVDTLYVKTPH